MAINDSTPVADPITAAHVQNVTLHITECIPAHEPRASDPHYKYFNEARTRLAALGKLQCWVCGTTEQIELHHSTVEFAFANGVDLTKFEKLYPEFKIESDEDFLKWIEGEGNLLPLCQTGDTPVLMADGSQKVIANIVVGDIVVGHDLRAHRVSGIGSRHVSEYITSVNGYGATDEHPFLISGAWGRADSLTDSVLVLQVLGMCGEEAQVLDSVVRLDSVDMMDSFIAGQRAPQGFLHDVPVLHNRRHCFTTPHGPANVPLWRNGPAEESLGSSTRSVIKSGESAGIGAVHLLRTLATDELYSAHAADLLLGMHKQIGRASGALTRFPAGSIPFGQLGRSDELRSANSTRQFCEPNQPALQARWTTPNNVHRVFHDGLVYHIEVEGSNSYIGGGLAVHNCKLHHTGIMGIHVLDYPVFLIQRFYRADLAPAAKAVFGVGKMEVADGETT